MRDDRWEGAVGPAWIRPEGIRLRIEARRLRTEGRPAETVAAAYERAILALPQDREALTEWLALPLPGSPAERISGLLSRAESLPRVAVAALVAALGVEGAWAVLGGRAEAWFASPRMLAAERLWRAHAEGRPIGDPGEAAGLGLSEWILFFLLRLPARRCLRATALSEAEKSELSALGIAWRPLRLDLRASLARDPTRGAEPRYASETARRRVEASERFCRWQDRAFATGAVTFRDPVGGEVRRAADSHAAFGRVFYLFPGDPPFYLVAAGAGSMAKYLYVPRHELLLDLGSPMAGVPETDLANSLAFLAGRLARHAALHDRALEPDVAEPRPRRLAVLIQGMENFAHHAWNFYPGLERALRDGHGGRISRVVFGGTEFYGPIGTIFPEVADRVEPRDRREPLVDPAPFSRDELLLPVGGYFVPDSLRERLRRAVAAAPRRPGAETPEDHPPAWPTIWIGLRLGDKAWTDQEEGIPRLLARLLPRYPGMRVLLDGFSHPVGRDEVTARWAAARETLRGLAERVREAAPEPLRAPGRVVNMVGDSLRESLLWAGQVHAYLAPVGTTQHKVGWFSSAPGVVYTPPRGREMRDEEMPGAWEAEGIRVPRYVTGRPVAAGQRRGANDRRRHLDLVTLDPEEVADLLSELIGPAP